MNTFSFERAGTRLSYQDLGGSGPPMLLLHGLAGYGGEWASSARWLVREHRVFALDQRGHGDSTRRPDDVSRVAFVEDCAAAIGHIGLGPLTLVGQSMGSNTALLTAAAHPDLVPALVMIEGSPDGPEPPVSGSEIEQQFMKMLSAWPVPFSDANAAASFFSSKGFDPAAWTGGLERRSDGLWPKWEATTLAATMADLGSRSYWEEWRGITCPTLVILGEHGLYPPDYGDELVSQLPGASVVTIRGPDTTCIWTHRNSGSKPSSD